MKLISEYNDYAISPVIIEQNEKGEKEYYIEGVFMQSEIKNRNGRVYPKDIMEKGELVPDDLILDLVKDRITENDCCNGFLFDGFPRTLDQATALKNRGVEIDCVIEIMVDDDEIVKRMSGRRVHSASGRTYHITHNPPKQEGLDDETSEALIQRPDDNEETVKKRLTIYHEQTYPLVEFYKNLSTNNKSCSYIEINGIGGIDDIQSQITANIEKLT